MQFLVICHHLCFVSPVQFLRHQNKSRYYILLEYFILGKKYPRTKRERKREEINEVCSFQCTTELKLVLFSFAFF